MLKGHNFQKTQIDTVVLENMLSSYNRYKHLPCQKYIIH